MFNFGLRCSFPFNEQNEENMTTIQDVVCVRVQQNIHFLFHLVITEPTLHGHYYIIDAFKYPEQSN